MVRAGSRLTMNKFPKSITTNKATGTCKLPNLWLSEQNPNKAPDIHKNNPI